jgi:predicted kinase
MMCGVAGSGKTTFAQKLERAGYIRLSVDEEMWRRFGRYGVDYAEARYPEFSAQAEDHLKSELVSALRRGSDVVVDFSFWQRSRRDAYKQLIEGVGAVWRLIYLKVPEEALRSRLQNRAGRFDANAAFPITEAILASYLAGFEEPKDEGEETIEIERF